eukprot:GEMP01047080.1.p1 GENE.GEMP01047080.1~~GEMP01047080.1.p1  ORF type:complete len:311 (-),score=68.46 GEMP01047080.1:747-1679(-)
MSISTIDSHVHDAPILFGVIGSSGIDEMEGVEVLSARMIHTPFGDPSDKVVIAQIVTARGDKRKMAFLPRNGRGHFLSPTEVPYRANIWALKSLGVKYLVGLSACGSLIDDDYAPASVVIPDDQLDMTRGIRAPSFFAGGVVAHVSGAEPYCEALSKVCYDAVADVGGKAHLGGTFVTIEGPRFSTKAESKMFKMMGAKIVGMTNAPECFLAREAEMSYTVMAYVIDYDCWHAGHTMVNADGVLKRFHANAEVAKLAVIEALRRVDEDMDSKAFGSLCNGGAVMTSRKLVTLEMKHRLSMLVNLDPDENV